jgi:hypothetical protein
MTDLNLGGLGNANDLLRRVGAEQILVLLQRLGFWVGGDNPLAGGRTRKTFPLDISKLESGSLGDESSYWQSELSRVVAILGALQARRLEAEFQLKRASNLATASLMRSYRESETKVPTQSALNAEVAERPEVQEAEEALLVVKIVLEALMAVKECYEGYCRSLSREVSRRGDLLRAGIQR